LKYKTRNSRLHRRLHDLQPKLQATKLYPDLELTRHCAFWAGCTTNSFENPTNAEEQ